MTSMHIRNGRDDAPTGHRGHPLDVRLTEHYRREGYAVRQVEPAADRTGDVHLKLQRGRECILVRILRGDAGPARHDDLDRLVEVRDAEGASEAVLVASGGFTRAAVDAASGDGRVRLVDGEAVRMMLGPTVDDTGPTAPVDRASQFAAAADGRPPPRPRPDARTARRAERRSTLIWLAITVGGALLFVVLIRGVLEKTRWTAGPPQASVMAGPAAGRG